MGIGCESHSSNFIAGPINGSVGPDDFELQGDQHRGNMEYRVSHRHSDGMQDIIKPSLSYTHSDFLDDKFTIPNPYEASNG
jgi:hypothetical protein